MVVVSFRVIYYNKINCCLHALVFYMQVLTNEDLKSMMCDMRKMSPEEVEEQYGGEEVLLFLTSLLLLTTAGHRPSAISRMQVRYYNTFSCCLDSHLVLQVGEFRKARPSKDGVMVVRVVKHKTFKGHGVARVPFALEGIHEAAQKFALTYKGGAVEKDFFLSLSGQELKMAKATNWLKQFLDLTEKESKTFTPKIWRHAWGNWAADHPDSEVGKLAKKVMCHSESVFESNYEVTNNEEAVRFVQAVLEGTGGKDDQEGPRRPTMKDNTGASGPRRPTMKDKTGASGVITAEDRKILKDILWEGGAPPKSLGIEAMKKAVKNKSFKKVYDKIVKSKNGDERAARNTITKSVMPKKKK